MTLEGPEAETGHGSRAQSLTFDKEGMLDLLRLWLMVFAAELAADLWTQADVCGSS